jgi:hypothetical protein
MIKVLQKQVDDNDLHGKCLSVIVHECNTMADAVWLCYCLDLNASPRPILEIKDEAPWKSVAIEQFEHTAEEWIRFAAKYYQPDLKILNDREGGCVILTSTGQVCGEYYPKLKHGWLDWKKIPLAQYTLEGLI